VEYASFFIFEPKKFGLTVITPVIVLSITPERAPLPTPARPIPPLGRERSLQTDAAGAPAAPESLAILPARLQ
jgi:hypothetical protein